MIAFFAGEIGSEVDHFEKLLVEGYLTITPPVVSEILSDPELKDDVESVICSLPRVPIKDGFWERVGYLRQHLLSRKRKAWLAGAMIAQVCIDHDLTLITRDADFKAYGKYSGLKILGC